MGAPKTNIVIQTLLTAFFLSAIHHTLPSFVQASEKLLVKKVPYVYQRERLD